MGRGKLTDINICSCLQWYQVCCATKTSASTEGLEVTMGSAGSFLLGTILKRASYKAPCRPCGQFHILHILAMEHPRPWSRACTRPTVNISLIPPLVSNNNIALLRCGYMCAGTLVDISRHLARMSNNNINKRFQL